MLPVQVFTRFIPSQKEKVLVIRIPMCAPVVRSESRLQQPSSVNDDLGSGHVVVLLTCPQTSQSISHEPTHSGLLSRTHGDGRDNTLGVILCVTRSTKRNTPILLESILSTSIGRRSVGHSRGEVSGSDRIDSNTEISSSELGGELVREGDGSGPMRRLRLDWKRIR
jgi:hypothetical protein